MQRHEFKDKNKSAQRHADVSGDYTADAKSTANTGHIGGPSIDEYGFFEETDQDVLQDETRDSFHGSCDSPGQPPGISDTGLRKQHNRLHQIQRHLLQEP